MKTFSSLVVFSGTLDHNLFSFMDFFDLNSENCLANDKLEKLGVGHLQADQLTIPALLSTSYAQVPWTASATAAATSTVASLYTDIPAIDPDLPYYSIPAIAPVYTPPPPIGVPRESKAPYTYTWTA